MKNIHVLPGDIHKPSQLYFKDGDYKLDTRTIAMDWFISSAGYKPHTVYITSDEEIKEGDWCYDKVLNFVFQTDNQTCFKYANQTDNVLKIILTTDQDLIKDGVLAIGDGFLEWFIKNPSCEKVEVELKTKQLVKPYDVYNESVSFYKIIIPKEEPRQETFTKPDTIDGEWLSPIPSERQWQEEQLVNIFEHYPNASPKWQYMNGLIQNGLDAKKMYSVGEVLEIFEQFKMNLPFHYEFLVKEALHQLKKK